MSATVRQGWRCGYPLCCILRFAVDGFVTRLLDRWREPFQHFPDRGAVYAEPGSTFVPCCHLWHRDWAPGDCGRPKAESWRRAFREVEYIPARRRRLTPLCSGAVERAAHRRAYRELGRVRRAVRRREHHVWVFRDGDYYCEAQSESLLALGNLQVVLAREHLQGPTMIASGRRSADA
jgi:hypothetical protein